MTVVCVLILGAIIGGKSYLGNYYCTSTFGIELNQRRAKLHIPLLPSSWHVLNKDETYSIWVPQNQMVIGHGFKEVVYRGCELDEELDHYYFDLKNPHNKVLEINYKYVNSKRKIDSTLFTLQIGNYDDTISKTKADSILKTINSRLD